MPTATKKPRERTEHQQKFWEGVEEKIKELSMRTRTSKKEKESLAFYRQLFDQQDLVDHWMASRARRVNRRGIGLWEDFNRLVERFAYPKFTFNDVTGMPDDRPKMGFNLGNAIDELTPGGTYKGDRRRLTLHDY